MSGESLYTEAQMREAVLAAHQRGWEDSDERIEEVRRWAESYEDDGTNIVALKAENKRLRNLLRLILRLAGRAL
jgi:cell shape-determining protein MreC